MLCYDIYHWITTNVLYKTNRWHSNNNLLAHIFYSLSILSHNRHFHTNTLSLLLSNKRVITQTFGTFNKYAKRDKKRWFVKMAQNEMITLKNAADKPNGFSFRTRGRITNVNATFSFLKCENCWRKVPNNSFCSICKIQNPHVYSLLLKVFFPIY